MSRRHGPTGSLKANLALLAIAVGLLALYMYTLAGFLAAPPSTGMSREITLATVASGFVENARNPVLTIQAGADQLDIVAIDGQRTRLLRVSAQGQVLADRSLDLNLYKIAQLDGYRSGPDQLTLYYNQAGLFRAIVDTRNLTWQVSQVAADTRCFASYGDSLVYETTGGLYGLTDVALNDATIQRQAKLLLAGRILSWDAAFDDGACRLLASVGTAAGQDLVLVAAEAGFGDVRSRVLAASSNSDYLRRIEDVYWADGQLTSLHVWTNRRDNVNHLTLRTFSLAGDDLAAGELTAGEQAAEWQRTFAIHRGPFTITRAAGQTVEVLMQAHTLNGVNLVLADLSAGQPLSVYQLTKTRHYSKPGRYFQLDGENCLVFWDFELASRTIQFASSHPALIAQTTRLWTINPGYLLMLTAFAILMAFFTGGIAYLLLTSLIPLMLLVATNRLPSRFGRHPWLRTALAAGLQTVLKTLLTWHTINIMGNDLLLPPLVGREPWLYLAMVATSAISYLFLAARLKRHPDNPEIASEAYVSFIGVEYLQYSLLILVYVCTGLLIGKL
ncbi:MAG: hypothetical protein A2087_14705 [Spirochaetes bacterium GWD1_61_31]|nr:MAG: hypothetical protein A2Y37_12950 [Spirochaetes bacterium GWB1_60_80]OHD28689.1 MAG: hypothetical protein A2004_05900 [Spirochaetes bacterium GWC1_61_12]OHD38889.1 MAG: hypothetical protein A2087_14705 [Spirochaetes bacterium GWD1_61_31]OHD43332.1 MAG: hypothetical protein A2Y35_08645 [Spirochaetes bacterium GWE1_60_18]OHD58870.1 MAG: hypothetical protein A2Y32_09015 [Spirochaetes bacterium GWF1_60_12]HAP42525.1 hypothetical protein [Spirochaetaceae bacterium]